MLSLRHTDWFQDCFCASQEYEPEQVAQPVIDSPLEAGGVDGGEDVGVPDGAADPDPPESDEHAAKRDALRWMIGHVGGSALGARSVPPETLDEYVKSMSPDETHDLVHAHTKQAPTPKLRSKLPRNKSASLAVRRAVGDKYLEFLRGEGAVLD